MCLWKKYLSIQFNKYTDTLPLDRPILISEGLYVDLFSVGLYVGQFSVCLYVDLLKRPI